ncbi:uncharacterized protein EAF01_004880 [Botrytis porri]|uniref:Uncharacterized protein n=1 Tax=Botrytis porri TaxID=87229 RepID=A0A4Z1KKI8_9HELO|nr:uncharacterized protein EAF01_004880 [Botrytis porri]KAF7907293.1 hypothetical protein EAF01_004880 [Botrytis porri]TGO86000.1 hypothetical protein BPOR_0345g00110 [Botrytis porri]
MGSINALGDGKKYEERAIEIEWERNKLYIHLAARNNPGTFHWSLYLTEEQPERGWVYHVFDPVPDRWVLEMLGGDAGEERVMEKGDRDGGWGGDSSEDSESPGQESGEDGDQHIIAPEGESNEGREDVKEIKKKYEEKRKRESGDTGHRSDGISDEDERLESDKSVKEKEEERKHKRNKTDNEENQERDHGSYDLEDPRNSKNHDTKDNNHTFLTSSSLLAAIEIGTDIQDMRSIIEETISTEWETGRKKIAKGEKICREFLLKCVEELESVGVLSFREGKGIVDVEREAEEFGLLSDPALNVAARRGRVWKSRVVE